MKIILSIVVVLIVGTLVFIGVKNNNTIESEQDVTATSTDSMAVVLPDSEYQVDIDSSNLIWTGVKELIANYKDVGTLKVKEGKFMVVGNNITSGEIIFDINSLAGTETSNTEIGIEKLATHLKSADFFDVAKYPTAKIVIKSAIFDGDDYIVTGDLTIKDVTNEISFPAKISLNDDSTEVVLDGDVMFDRTKWELKYGSGSFFDDLGNNIIGDQVSVSVHIVAKALKV